MNNTRKQIAFDIDTKVAEQILGEGYRKLYDNIESFAKANGFSHIQGSVYESQKPMTNTDVYIFLNALNNRYPYIEKCIRDIRQTNISGTYSLNHLFDYDGTPGKFVQQDNKTDSLNPPEKNREDFSFKQGSEKTSKVHTITQPVRTEVTLEQATKMAQAGIPFQIMHGDNQKVMAVFDKSDIEKVKQIKNPSLKKSRGR